MPKSGREASVPRVGQVTPIHKAAAYTLKPHEQLCNVSLLAATTDDDYSITLPKLADCDPDAVFLVVAFDVVSTGNGEVAVIDQDDGVWDLSVGDSLSAVGDYIMVQNAKGKGWVVLKEVTT